MLCAPRFLQRSRTFRVKISFSFYAGKNRFSVGCVVCFTTRTKFLFMGFVVFLTHAWPADLLENESPVVY